MSASDLESERAVSRNDIALKAILRTTNELSSQAVGEEGLLQETVEIEEKHVQAAKIAAQAKETTKIVDRLKELVKISHAADKTGIFVVVALGIGVIVAPQFLVLLSLGLTTSAFLLSWAFAIVIILEIALIASLLLFPELGQYTQHRRTLIQWTVWLTVVIGTTLLPFLALNFFPELFALSALVGVSSPFLSLITLGIMGALIAFAGLSLTYAIASVHPFDFIEFKEFMDAVPPIRALPEKNPVILQFLEGSEKAVVMDMKEKVEQAAALSESLGAIKQLRASSEAKEESSLTVDKLFQQAREYLKGANEIKQGIDKVTSVISLESPDVKIALKRAAVLMAAAIQCVYAAKEVDAQRVEDVYKDAAEFILAIKTSLSIQGVISEIDAAVRGQEAMKAAVIAADKSAGVGYSGVTQVLLVAADPSLTAIIDNVDYKKAALNAYISLSDNPIRDLVKEAVSYVSLISVEEKAQEEQGSEEGLHLVEERRAARIEQHRALTKDYLLAAVSKDAKKLAEQFPWHAKVLEQLREENPRVPASKILETIMTWGQAPEPQVGEEKEEAGQQVSSAPKP